MIRRKIKQFKKRSIRKLKELIIEADELEIIEGHLEEYLEIQKLKDILIKKLNKKEEKNREK